MTTTARRLTSPDDILKTLLAKGAISEKNAGEIRRHYDSLLKKLEKKRTPSGNGNFQIESASVTAIDVLASLNLTRKDFPSRLLDEDALCRIMAEAWRIPYRKIDPLKLDLNQVTTTIPRSFAFKNLMLPLSIQNDTLTVAMANPFDDEAINDISRACQMKVEVVFSTRSDIIKYISEFYGFRHFISEAENRFGDAGVDLSNLEQYVRLKSADEVPSNDQHIVNAVNHLFSYALDQRASDIHIEPKREVSLVRMRIDGLLHTIYRLPRKVHPAIVSRIKNLSRMDMSEKRRPQDGRIKTNKAGAEVEIRISTIPVAFGEKVVMRIMDPDILFQDLDKLGFSSTDLIRYNHFIKLPHGIVLVCGPTGSGKSTTLYSTLKELSSPTLNITTIEDPIEMVHEDFNQIAVQPAIGITFATILRNILRQDPDIIMVGELRDLETAQNAIQAALTGHLVLSTIHTNDAPSTVIRLLDLGVPAFLIQATLVGMLSQRLVRKICPYCKEPFEMEAEELLQMGIATRQSGTVRMFRGKGCDRCRGTGYHGRIAIYEVLAYSDAMKNLTNSSVDLNVLRNQALSQGMISLRDNAVKKLLEGVTTYQEVLRVTWEQK
ncbi:MAG: GspE/PulE family protein [Desulfatirhabdiaceae bacterium]|nr:GspE/PulE family protein [Desulfatirhabdiaceae bacterium]